MLIKPTRTATQRGTPGAPSHPTPPSKRLRGRPAILPPWIAPGLLQQPQYPSPDASLVAQLAGATDDATKLAASPNHIMHAIAAGAPIDQVEKQIQVQPGSLVAHLIADRSLLPRFCVALVQGSHAKDRQAQTVLAAVAGGAVRTPAVRAALDFANTFRCQAEADRRLSESLLRKVARSADNEEARTRAKSNKAWSEIIGASNAFPPDAPIEVPAGEPLAVARQLLPQLQAALIAKQADGDVSALLAKQVQCVERYIRRQVAPGNQATETAKATAPTTEKPSTPTPTLRAPGRPTITDEYLTAHPEARHQHEHGGRITSDLLRATLEWVEAQSQTPLRLKQIASLKGRIRACSLDEQSEHDAEPKQPAGAMRSTAGEPITLNLNFGFGSSTTTPKPPAKSAEHIERVQQLRDQVAMSRRDTRGLPAGAAAVHHLHELEGELEELEGKMS
jgi:hypothetical protein